MRGKAVGCTCAGEDRGMGRASGSVPAGEGWGEKPWKLGSGFWPGQLGCSPHRNATGRKGAVFGTCKVSCVNLSPFLCTRPRIRHRIGGSPASRPRPPQAQPPMPHPHQKHRFLGLLVSLHVNTDMHLEKAVQVAPFSLLPGGNCLLTPTCLPSWGFQRPAHVLTRSHSDICYSCSPKSIFENIKQSHNGSDFWEPPPALSLANKRPDGLSH